MEALSMLPQSLWGLWALFMLNSRALYSWYFPCLLALILFLTSFWWNLLSLGERHLVETKFRAEYSKDCYSLSNIWLWFSTFIPTCCRRRLLWSTRTVKYQWVNSFIFYYTSIVGFCPWSPLYLVSGFWSIKQCQVLVPSHEVGLKSNELLVFTPTSIVSPLFCILAGRTSL